MLLKPYVYTGHMEGVPTIGENPQYIITMVFHEANSASATLQITILLAQNTRIKKNMFNHFDGN